MAATAAETILTDFDNQKSLLSDAGYPDFTLEGITAEGLDAVKTQMSTLLADRGVTDQWKNFPDTEPFFMMTPEVSPATPATV